MMELSQFHFLRPQWLLALLPLALLGVWMLRRQLYSRSWQSVIDKQLLPYVLIGKPGKNSRWPLMLFIICGVLSITALAGPSWQKLPQPVYKKQSALIIALDLSRSMNAGDIKPSRLARARYKISDLLKLRREGQTGLIVYAADAFTVSPLTDDAATIDALIPGLETGMMPAQGSRADRALAQAGELLSNAGISNGHILLITDHVDNDQLDAFKQSVAAGYSVSIIGSGSSDGAPIPADRGGFVKDASGAIVITKLDSGELRKAALTGGGVFSKMTVNDADIKKITRLLDQAELNEQLTPSDFKSDVWREQGPWLLLMIIPLAALAFRRGYLLALVFISLPYAPQADAISWDELWYNSNQRAEQKLRQQQPGEAAELFSDPQWKSAAQYQAGNYQQALETLQQVEGAGADYNRGNALAKLGRYEEALQAYQKALEENPQHEDAQYNKQQIEELLRQQQQDQQQNQQQDSQQNSEQNDDNSEQNSQQSDAGQQNDQQQSQSQSDSQQNSQQQDQQPSSSDNTSDPEHQEASSSPSPDEQQTEQQQSQSTTKQPEQTADGDEQTEPQQAATNSDEQQAVSQQKVEQWLRKIPDDPSGLLRRKFEYQYKRRPQQTNESDAW